MTAHAAVRVEEDLAAASRAAAEEVARAAREAVAARGRFTLGLTGGATPRELYALLAADAAFPWARTHAFFSDERCVPPDHPDSNYGMAREALLSRVPVAAVHRMEGELPPADAALRHEADLKAAFALDGGAPPALDLLLLGLGADGHVASLFPRTAALGERARLCVANEVPRLGATRLTLTVPVLNEARRVLFLVAGEQKAWAVRAAFDGACEPEDVPARLVRPDRTRWIVDRAAASRLG